MSNKNYSTNQPSIAKKTIQEVEYDMLNDLEASTNRIKTQANWLNTETKQHVVMAGVIEKEYEASRDALKRETTGISEATQMRGGVWWMYGVIAAEAILLVILIWDGL